MLFVADENIETLIVRKLREDGHSVLYIAEYSPSVDDEEVLKIANSENRILITEDKGFGDLVFRWRQVTTGILFLRLYGIDTSSKAEILSKIILKHGDKLENAFSVISLRSFRIKKLKL